MSVEPFVTMKGPLPQLVLTLGELMEAEPALTRLLDVKLSAQLAYNLAKMAKAVTAETTHFKEQRDTLIREYGEPVPEQADAIRVKPEHVGEFTHRMKELAAVEVTLMIAPLRLADLPDMTGADLLKLGSLVLD